MNSFKQLLCLLSAILLGTPGHTETLFISAQTIYTSGEAGIVRDGNILVVDGKIAAVGASGTVAAPQGSRQLSARVVLPGLIDSHTVVGANGGYNEPADQDAFEKTDALGAQYRVLDSFNPVEKLVRYVLSYGTTTIHVTPQPTAPIAGATAVFKTHGELADSMLLKSDVAMMFNLGTAPKEAFSESGGPVSRMATTARIRGELYKARAWQAKSEDERDPDLGMAALARVLDGDTQAIFTAHREDDIATALRITAEFGLQPIINYGTEVYLVREPVKKAGAAVIMAPTMQRVAGMEKLNTSLEAAAILETSGIPFVFATGFEAYVPKSRVLLWEIGVAIANGLDAERAVRAATIDPATLWGIDHRVGSLDPGKDADLVLFDGDPFEYTSHVTQVIADGAVLDPASLR